MKELTITVSGEAGTGKSTMVLWLELFLKKKGFNVEIDTENEIVDYGSDLRFRNVVSTDFDKKIDIIKADRKITLKSIQVQREPTKNENTETKSTKTSKGKGKTNKNN